MGQYDWAIKVLEQHQQDNISCVKAIALLKKYNNKPPHPTKLTKFKRNVVRF